MIKSADDLNEQKRDTEVLLNALDKCSTLENMLNMAMYGLEHYSKNGNFAEKVLNKIRGLKNDNHNHN